THSLVREKRHQSSLEAETHLIAHVRAEVPTPGGGPLVAVRDLTTQLLTERTRRQEGIEIVEEVRRGVEMRVMVDRADLVIFSRIPVQRDVGKPPSPGAWLIEGRVVQPWIGDGAGGNSGDGACPFHMAQGGSHEWILCKSQPVGRGKCSQIDGTCRQAV